MTENIAQVVSYLLTNHKPPFHSRMNLPSAAKGVATILSDLICGNNLNKSSLADSDIVII